MPIEGVDYAWARPSPAGLVGAGKHFACRYLSNKGNSKNLTPAEARALSAGKVSIVSNWEWRAGDARLGFDAGADYARQAQSMAASCGMPPDRPIYFSVDWGPTDAELRGPVTAYLRGVGSVLGIGRTGVYGGYNTIAWAHDNGLARWLWQTYAWSAGRWHPAAHIQQYRNGVTVAGTNDIDLDRAMVADYGQWTVGQQVSIEGDDDMTQAEYDELLTRVKRTENRVTTLLYNAATNQWGEGGEKNALHDKLETLTAPAPVLLSDAQFADLKAAIVAAVGEPLTVEDVNAAVDAKIRAVLNTTRLTTTTTA